MLKSRNHTPWNPANLVTLTRIGLTPVVAAFLYPWGADGGVPGARACLWAALTFAIAMLGDSLDGYLARSRGEITPLGKLLDPLADKLMVLVLLVLLVPFGWVPVWLVALLLARELFINSLRAISAERKLVIQASRLGKYKTVYQSAALTGLLLHYRMSEVFGVALPAPLDFSGAAVGTVLLYISAFISVWSGVDYFGRFWGRIAENPTSS